jgi:DNA-binding NarL/FixJ family response regulator
VKDVLIASDSATVREEVAAVLSSRDHTVRYVTAGASVRAAIVDRAPDLLICDFQIGSMGGVAVTLDVRLEESADRIPRVPVLLLLDRRADVFLARRSGADGYVVKPLDPIRLRRAIAAVLGGGRFVDDSYRPAESAAAV